VPGLLCRPSGQSGVRTASPGPRPGNTPEPADGAAGGGGRLTPPPTEIKRERKRWFMYDQYGNKLVRKAIPYQLYDMAGLQQWFEEMSAKGFLLDSFGIRTGIFRVGEPAPGVRYRLEPQTYWDQSLDYDKNEAYAKMGWEYVDFIGHYYYIYRAEDPETGELHTDPMTQSYVFDRYLKRHLRAFFAFLVLALGQL